MAGTIIKGKRELSNEERKMRESLSLENGQAQGGVLPLTEWNTKHPLDDDAVIRTALGKCLQHSLCVCCSGGKKSRSHRVQCFHLCRIIHTPTHKHTYSHHIHEYRNFTYETWT